jgi:hypothetical protein
MLMDYRATLELPLYGKLTPDQIRHAYYRQCRRHHPDRHGGNQARFLEVRTAYEQLMNKTKTPDDTTTNRIAAILVNLAHNLSNLYWQHYDPTFATPFSATDTATDNTTSIPVPTCVFTPSLSDMLGRKVGAYSTKSAQYLIPYWFDSVEYDASGSLVWLVCEPVLPKGCSIDNEGVLQFDIVTSAVDVAAVDISTANAEANNDATNNDKATNHVSDVDHNTTKRWLSDWYPELLAIRWDPIQVPDLMPPSVAYIPHSGLPVRNEANILDTANIGPVRLRYV